MGPMSPTTATRHRSHPASWRSPTASRSSVSMTSDSSNSLVVPAPGSISRQHGSFVIGIAFATIICWSICQ